MKKFFFILVLAFGAFAVCPNAVSANPLSEALSISATSVTQINSTLVDGKRPKRAGQSKVDKKRAKSRAKGHTCKQTHRKLAKRGNKVRW